MDDQTSPGCIALFIVTIALVVGSNFMPPTPKKTPFPTYTPAPTPTYAGPTAADCEKETNPEWADLCWQEVEQRYNDRPMPDYEPPDDLPDDPMEGELWDVNP